VVTNISMAPAAFGYWDDDGGRGILRNAGKYPHEYTDYDPEKLQPKLT
jgi:hypothetical protein